MSDNDCTVTGTVGVIVQLALAVLVLVVLITEYVFEHIQYYCKRSSPRINRHDLHKPRKLRTFWFDSFKICTGALVSHGFNILVAVLVTSSARSNECAVYALSFYYEACGVPFVQLLQYGAIQYARTMSKKTDISKNCRTAWDYIATPGIYLAPNRFNTEGCFSSCDDSELCGRHVAFSVLLFIGVGISLLAGYFFYILESIGLIFIDISAIVLVFTYYVTFIVAPNASLIQTFEWVIVKIVEKSIWSCLALAQTTQFAKWSLKMSTGKSTTDAWLFIALIPIIMNAFMFFMFSRISRLKIPCFNVKFRSKLDQKLERAESSEFIDYSNNNSSHNNSNNNLTGSNHSSNNNDSGSDLHIASDIDETDSNILINNSNNINKNNNYNQYGNSNKKNKNYARLKDGNNASNDVLRQSAMESFDVQEAIRVGIVYTLIVNTTLLVLAIIYLELNDAPMVWLLGITMLIAPLVIAGFAILWFRYLVDNRRNVCFCCCRHNQQFIQNGNYKNYDEYSSYNNYNNNQNSSNNITSSYRSPSNPDENENKFEPIRL